MLLHLVGDVGVVHEQAQHVDRPLGLLTDMLCDPDRVDHAVAIAPGRDLQYIHELSFTR